MSTTGSVFAIETLAMLFRTMCGTAVALAILFQATAALALAPTATDARQSRRAFEKSSRVPMANSASSLIDFRRVFGEIVAVSTFASWATRSTACEALTVEFETAKSRMKQR